MKSSEKLDDAIERMNIQETWTERLDKLTKSRRAFCKDHSIDTSVLCRFEKLNMAAGWVWINRMENALKAEGV